MSSYATLVCRFAGTVPFKMATWGVKFRPSTHLSRPVIFTIFMLEFCQETVVAPLGAPCVGPSIFLCPCVLRPAILRYLRLWHEPVTSKLPSVFVRERKSGKRETQFKEQRKHRAKGFFLKKILNILGRTADTNFGKVQNRPLASSDKLKTFGYTNQLLIARHVTFGLVIQSDDVRERDLRNVMYFFGP